MKIREVAISEHTIRMRNIENIGLIGKPLQGLFNSFISANRNEIVRIRAEIEDAQIAASQVKLLTTEAAIKLIPQEFQVDYLADLQRDKIYFK